MALPTAVRKKADAAAELIRQASGAGNDDGEAARLKSESERLTGEVTRLTQANRVLQEKYNAEVPRYAEEVKQLKARIAELEAAATKRFEAGEISSLSEDERERLGPDVIAASTKIAREVIASEFDKRLKPLTESVDRFRRMTEAAYNATLDREVPDWSEQNNDKAFLAWLQQLDPATGRLRDDLLQSAHALQQGYVVADIFRAFKEGREIGSPKAAAPSPDPNGGVDTQPNTGDGTGGKRIWSRAEIQQFYRDKRENRYAGKEAEARALENDIFAAQSENRVR